jgi:hypothetical protein
LKLVQANKRVVIQNRGQNILYKSLAHYLVVHQGSVNFVLKFQNAMGTRGIVFQGPHMLLKWVIVPAVIIASTTISSGELMRRDGANLSLRGASASFESAIPLPSSKFNTSRSIVE